MNKYIASLFSVLLVSNLLWGQGTITLSGRVEDRESGTGVGFASVGLQHSPLSTVTNLDGYFTIKLPRFFSSDSIIFSSIGYNVKKISVESLSKPDPLVVKLIQSEKILDGVVVTDSLTASEIMHLALQKMKENHPSDPASMEVFYRERQLLDGAYVSLVEAALTIYDEYNVKKRKSPLRTKVRVNQLRRSLVYKHPFNSWWQQDNLMMHSWRLNPIPYDSRSLEKSAKKDEFKRVGMASVLGKSAFVVETDNTDFWKTTYYIQNGTYAVVRVEENFDEAIDGAKHWEMQGDSLPLNVHFKTRHVTVDFNKIDNKYHPTYIRVDASHEYHHEDKLLAQFGIIQDFIINDINWEDPTVIERNEATRIGKSLVSKDYPYNEDFWNSYNVIKETPLETQLIKDLEQRASSLSVQFEQNQKSTDKE